jgi:hypothetical protein
MVIRIDQPYKAGFHFCMYVGKQLEAMSVDLDPRLACLACRSMSTYPEVCQLTQKYVNLPTVVSTFKKPLTTVAVYRESDNIQGDE